ncbi:MAG: carbohydrate binding family 9 domain-containing protein [Candidatus Thermoplasmatota archaeon]|nr:carbohydrate binding family 9 domain-containing protein [Candidatus Thermoplasmatota archaeon]
MKPFTLLSISIRTFIFLIIMPISSQAQIATNLYQNQGAGTSEDPYIVPKTDIEITVNAVLDETAWSHALKLELNYEVRPGENVTPAVRTEVLITYNQNNFYAAFRCYDPDPSAIRAHLRDRDTLGGDDWIALVLDTFNDERRSYNFAVTAQGVQFDEIETRSGEDEGWDAIWDCASQITDWGYLVEMAIPFSSFRFQRKEGSQVWGFDAIRRYPREHPYHIGLFPRDRSNNCYLCQALKMKGFEGASPGRNIEFDPTIIGFRSDERADFPHGMLKKQSQEAELGLTAHWGITPNLTTNFTINPDFSQVEADAQQLDINEPFALFYSERRPFFTEGNDFFAALKNIIYTRTMRDPSWGIKLTGKEGANAVGAYIVRDDITNLIFPGSQGSRSTSLNMANTSAVFRYKRDFGSRYNIGLVGTAREADDYFNRIYGFDLDFRLTPTNQIQLLVLGSSTKYPDEITNDFDEPMGAFSDRLISFEYDHYTRTWGWWADYEDAGSKFRADLGYHPMVDYRNVEGGLFRTWNAEQGSWWSAFRVGNELNYFEEQDGNPLYKKASLWLSYEGTMQSNFSIEGSRTMQMYHDHDFDLTYIMVEGSFWPSSNLQVSAYTTFGDQIDYANTRLGKRSRINPWLSYNLGKHLRLSVDHNYERMNVQDSRLYTANISQLSVVYQFTTRAFFRTIVQYVNYDYNPDNYTFDIDAEDERFLTQLLFSYKINPRTVLFLGYTDNYQGSENYNLTQSNRTFFAKLGYAYVM